MTVGKARRVAVFGATGVVGRAAAVHLAARGWDVVGVARRDASLPGVEAARVDLLDHARCRTGHPALAGATHVVFAAVYEEDQLVAGWREQRHVDSNVALLEGALALLEASAARPSHAVMLQGTKAYGGFVGGIPVPARERWPWLPSTNFYRPQAELLRQLAPDLTVTSLRPQAVFGEALGSNMNLTPALGAYGALLRSEGEPLHYPGGADVVTQAVDAALLAEAVEWSLCTPAAWGETFNVTNGEAFSLRACWPAIADALGMDVGETRACRTDEELVDPNARWERLARRFDLLEPDLGAVVGRSFQYLDLYSGVGLDHVPPPTLVSTVKVRTAGFAPCVDTEEMLARQLGALQRARVLPPRRW